MKASTVLLPKVSSLFFLFYFLDMILFMRCRFQFLHNSLQDILQPFSKWLLCTQHSLIHVSLTDKPRSIRLKPALSVSFPVCETLGAPHSFFSVLTIVHQDSLNSHIQFCFMCELPVLFGWKSFSFFIANVIYHFTIILNISMDYYVHRCWADSIIYLMVQNCLIGICIFQISKIIM